MTVLLALMVAVAQASAVEPPLDAVVSVQLGESTCGGAFVAPDRVVTAYHCIAGGGRAIVTTRSGLSATARIVARSVRDDLALLATPSMAPLVLPVRAEPPGIAEEVWAIGQPFGGHGYGFLEGTLGWAVSSGIVAAVGTRALQVTAPVAPGSSGGPVVDRDGRLVGVVSRRLRGDGLGFATRAEAVTALLSQPGGPSGLGGTVSVVLGPAFLSAPDGEVSIDGRLGIAIRDRVVLASTLGVPVTDRWRLLEYGSSRWMRASVRLGLRQRLGHGPQTTRLDGYGGVASIAVVEPYGAYGTRVTSRAAPLVGGSLAVYSMSVHALGVKQADGWLLQVATYLSFPGVFARF